MTTTAAWSGSPQYYLQYPVNKEEERDGNPGHGTVSDQRGAYDAGLRDSKQLDVLGCRAFHISSCHAICPVRVAPATGLPRLVTALHVGLCAPVARARPLEELGRLPGPEAPTGAFLFFRQEPDTTGLGARPPLYRGYLARTASPQTEARAKETPPGHETFQPSTVPRVPISRQVLRGFAGAGADRLSEGPASGQESAELKAFC